MRGARSFDLCFHARELSGSDAKACPFDETSFHGLVSTALDDGDDAGFDDRQSHAAQPDVLADGEHGLFDIWMSVQRASDAFGGANARARQAQKRGARSRASEQTRGLINKEVSIDGNDGSSSRHF